MQLRSRCQPKISVYMFLLLSSSPGSSELNEQRSRALQVDLIDRIVFVRILVVPTTSSADSLPLAVNLRTEAETQTWIFKIKLHTHTHKNKRRMYEGVWITYPFGLSERIWDLGEGELASGVNLWKETEPGHYERTERRCSQLKTKTARTKEKCTQKKKRKKKGISTEHELL